MKRCGFRFYDRSIDKGFLNLISLRGASLAATSSSRGPDRSLNVSAHPGNDLRPSGLAAASAFIPLFLERIQRLFEGQYAPILFDLLLSDTREDCIAALTCSLFQPVGDLRVLQA
ncbi:hypothetical protein ROLI_046270 (plasmid) [Roseobacter fucihabitans]|uniref:Uncharacterized protein n=1 Tax=Roseobacter fucihabitans TaxID=1537242 RepID=A0ABZ2C1L3_9RHOB|nr:hypothetical protein [Roseobacter litoralis]